MTINYGYYLPLSPAVFDSVLFLGITPKKDGFGPDAPQAHDKNGTPRWVVSALVKVGETQPETEAFTLTAPESSAKKVEAIPLLTPLRLRGLAGGKWSRANSDKTAWSFQITGLEVVAP